MGVVQIMLDDLNLNQLIIGWYKLFNETSVCPSLPTITSGGGGSGTAGRSSGGSGSTGGGGGRSGTVGGGSGGGSLSGSLMSASMDSFS